MLVKEGHLVVAVDILSNGRLENLKALGESVDSTSKSDTIMQK